jgi:hypothetical protein
MQVPQTLLTLFVVWFVPKLASSAVSRAMSSPSSKSSSSSFKKDSMYGLFDTTGGALARGCWVGGFEGGVSWTGDLVKVMCIGVATKRRERKNLVSLG